MKLKFNNEEITIAEYSILTNSAQITLSVKIPFDTGNLLKLVTLAADTLKINDGEKDVVNFTNAGITPNKVAVTIVGGYITANINMANNIMERLTELENRGN